MAADVGGNVVDVASRPTSSPEQASMGVPPVGPVGRGPGGPMLILQLSWPGHRRQLDLTALDIIGRI